MFIYMESLWRHFKIQKPLAPLIYAYIYLYKKKNISIHLVTQSL